MALLVNDSNQHARQRHHDRYGQQRGLRPRPLPCADVKKQVAQQRTAQVAAHQDDAGTAAPRECVAAAVGCNAQSGSTSPPVKMPPSA